MIDLEKMLACVKDVPYACTVVNVLMDGAMREGRLGIDDVVL